MPPLIGSRFMSDSELRDNIYSKGGYYPGIPLIVRKETYLQIAEDELHRGNLTDALEAYKRGLIAATEFISAIHSVSKVVLLDKGEMEKLNLGRSFGAVERALAQSIASLGVRVNTNDYQKFVKETRSNWGSADWDYSDKPEWKKIFDEIPVD